MGLVASSSAWAQVCPLVFTGDACVTGFDLNQGGEAADYLLPLTCQYSLTREIRTALEKKGYKLNLDRQLNDYQLKSQSVAALHCEQRKAGLDETSILDRATARLVLNRDILLERCKLAGYDEPTCPILKARR